MEKTANEIKDEFVDMIQSFCNKHIVGLGVEKCKLVLYTYSDGKDRWYEQFNLGEEIDYQRKEVR